MSFYFAVPDGGTPGEPAEAAPAPPAAVAACCLVVRPVALKPVPDSVAPVGHTL